MTCTCPVIITDDKGRTPCPVHEGFWRDGVFFRRCGDSDTTGGPYYVSGPPVVIKVVR